MPPRYDLKPPSRTMLALEGRGLLDIAGLFAAAPLLATAPRGTPHAVMVLPGLGADDRSTIAIRRFTSMLGYDVHGWGRGRNIRAAKTDLPAIARQVEDLHVRSKLPVSLIGWSRGGMLAREVAREIPHAVRLVITLGSPFNAPHASNVGAFWQAITGEKGQVAIDPSRCLQRRSTRARMGSSLGRPVSKTRALKPRTLKCARPISASASTRRLYG
jgi:pimeloyl-ACP methyl ester carboxylesterase